MSEHIEALARHVDAQLQGRATRVPALATELTIEVAAVALLDAARILRDTPELQFDTLIDVTVVDYSQFRLEQLGDPFGQWHRLQSRPHRRPRRRRNRRLRRGPPPVRALRSYTTCCRSATTSASACG